MKRLIASMMLLLGVLACSSKSDDPVATTTTTAEVSAMTKAQTATAATATNSNGLTKGTSTVVISSLGQEDNGSLNAYGEVGALADFASESSCAASGWPSSGTSGDAGYAMNFLLCSVLKRPDGPDTVRGGFDRITGMLCAIGAVTYDSTARDVTATFSTACFSQTFVSTACQTITGDSTSTGPCTATVTVTGYSSVTGVAPSGFEKYLTISALSGQLLYTIAYTSTSTTIAGAMMNGLPTTTDSSITDAFAFYIDSTLGLLRYEGRFSGTNKRHMRINLIGTVDTALAVTNVETLSFVQGENFGSTGGLTVSVHGTPAAGRRIRIQSSSDVNVSTPSWTASNSDDNTCIGETGAACTGNSGIVATDNKFFFGTGSSFTSSKTWFTSNSYLASVTNTVDMDDIWD